MNLSAIDIIIAKEWTGTLIFFSGDKRDSNPSVNAIGDVVYVKSTVEERMKITTRTNIKDALMSPSLYISMTHKVTNGSDSPFVIKMFNSAVKIRINTSGFIAFIDRKSVV